MRTYTTVQVAKLLGIGRDTIYRWMKAKKIRGSRVVQVGTGASFRVRYWTDRDVAQIRDYMKENYRKGRGRKPKQKR